MFTKVNNPTCYKPRRWASNYCSWSCLQLLLVHLLLILVFRNPSLGQLVWTTPTIIDTSTPLLTQQLCAFSASKDTVLTAAWVDYFNGGCYGLYETSSNNGLTWERHIAFDDNGGFFKCIRDLMIDNVGHVWIAWSFYPNEFDDPELRLSRSTNGGLSFEIVFTAQETANVFGSQLAVDPANNVYLLWDDTLLTLTRFRNGDTSQRFDTIIPTDTLLVDPQVSLAVDQDSRAYCIWEGSYYDEHLFEILFCSVLTDSGNNFSHTVRVDTSNAPLPWGGIAQQQPVVVIDPVGNISVAYRKVLQVNNEGIFLVQSDDHGQSFTPPVSVYTIGSNSDPDLAIDSLSGINFVWDSPDGLSFSRSSDGGSSFTDPQVIGSANGRISVAYDDVINVVFSNIRVYHTRTSLALSVVGHSQPFHSRILLQNYPNPFNSTTRIQFALTSSGSTVIEIFSILGQRIDEILNVPLPPGNYSVMWTPHNLSSGTYICRLLQKSDTGRIRRAFRMIVHQK